MDALRTTQHTLNLDTIDQVVMIKTIIKKTLLITP